MAVVTSSVLSTALTDSQDLFTISEVDGVVSYGSAGSQVTVVFPAPEWTAGSDISYNPGRSIFTLAGTANIVYTLQAAVTTRQVDPAATYGWYDDNTGNLVGQTAQVGQPLTVAYLNDTGNPVSLALQITNVNSEPFQIPAQIATASVTVQEVSGYTIA